MSARLKDWLERITVADGGWSTILAQRGWPADRPAELATVDAADLVRQLARDYLAAGAQLLSTNTFSCNRLAAAHRNITSDLAAINREAVRLLRAAAGDRARVAGVIGPTQRIVGLGEVGEDEVAEAIGAQAAALADGGADLLVLETFSELVEARAALRGARTAAPDTPVVVSLSFDTGPQRTQTMMRAEASDAARILEEHGADAVGANCGVGAALVLPAVVALRANCRLPVWVRPNAGLPELVHGLPHYAQTPEDFAGATARLVDAGANVLGGCCGIGPDHIRRLAGTLQARARRGGR